MVCQEEFMADEVLNPAVVLQRAAAQLRADQHEVLAASLKELGSHLSRQAATQIEIPLAGGQGDATSDDGRR